MKKLFLIAFAVLLLSGCGMSVRQNPGNNNTNSSAINGAPIIQNNNKLDLSNQNLTKVPDYVFNMTNLEELNISHNQITGAIQSQINQLKNLKVLDASNNLMTGVPAEVGQLTNLQTLDLSNNKLTGLPNELGNLKNLQTFNISGNNYSAQDLAGIIQKLPVSVNIIKNSDKSAKTIDVVGGYSYYLTTESLALTVYKNSAINRICFEPAQMETLNGGQMFCFTNTQAAKEILGIKVIDNTCKEYWGTAKIRIKNLTNKNISYSKGDPCSQAQNCQFNEAELVSVLDNFAKGPECQH